MNKHCSVSAGKVQKKFECQKKKHSHYDFATKIIYKPAKIVSRAYFEPIFLPNSSPIQPVMKVVDLPNHRLGHRFVEKKPSGSLNHELLCHLPTCFGPRDAQEIHPFGQFLRLQTMDSSSYFFLAQDRTGDIQEFQRKPGIAGILDAKLAVGKVARTWIGPKVDPEFVSFGFHCDRLGNRDMVVTATVVVPSVVVVMNYEIHHGNGLGDVVEWPQLDQQFTAERIHPGLERRSGALEECGTNGPIGCMGLNPAVDAPMEQRGGIGSGNVNGHRVVDRRVRWHPIDAVLAATRVTRAHIHMLNRRFRQIPVLVDGLDVVIHQGIVQSGDFSIVLRGNVIGQNEEVDAAVASDIPRWKGP